MSSVTCPMSNLPDSLPLLKLEQCCRTACPTGLALFLRDLLQIAHMSTRLRQDMVEIVSDTDEGESLFEEFAHAAGTEQEQAKNDVVLLRRVNQSVRCVHQFGGCVHIGELVLFIQSHGHAKVILAEEHDVQALYGRDFVDVL